jgi:hypothetical protein
LQAGTPGQTWRERFPGKRLLEAFAKRRGIRDTVALHNSIILGISQRRERVPEELMDLMQAVQSGGPFR